MEIGALTLLKRMHSNGTPEPEPAGYFIESAGTEWAKHGFDQVADMHANDEDVTPLYRKDGTPVQFDEARIDVVGQNGNDGLHYAQDEVPCCHQCGSENLAYVMQYADTTKEYKCLECGCAVTVADELDDDDPMWRINAKIKGLLVGDGAGEDHDDVKAFLRSTGLPEDTVIDVHRAICTANREN